MLNIDARNKHAITIFSLERPKSRSLYRSSKQPDQSRRSKLSGNAGKS